MLKTASEEVLGDSAIFWFQNPETNDFCFGVDGPDNEQLVSWHAVREGVIGFPTVLNHFDLWLNYKYKRAELEGFANLKEDAEDGWDYKEKEVQAEFAEFKKSAILGRISADLGVLNMVNPTFCFAKSQHAVEHLLKQGLINDDTALYINNYHLGPVGRLFEGENPVFTRFSQLFVSSQVESQKPSFDALNNSLMDLLTRYRASTDEAEKTRIKQETMWKILGDAPNEDENGNIIPAKGNTGHQGLIFQSISQFLPPEARKNPIEALSWAAEHVGQYVADKFLREYDPSKGSTIATYIGDMAQFRARKLKTKEFQFAITEDVLDSLAKKGVPAEILQKFEPILNKEVKSPSSFKYFVEKKVPEAVPYLPLIYKHMQYNRRPTDVTEGTPAGTGTKYEREDEKGGTSQFDTMTTDYLGNPREVAPNQNMLTSDALAMLEKINLNPEHKQFLKERYIDGKTLEQIGKERGFTKSRAQQIEKEVLNYIRRMLGGQQTEKGWDFSKSPVDVTHVLNKAKKQVFLSTAHKKLCE